MSSYDDEESDDDDDDDKEKGMTALEIENMKLRQQLKECMAEIRSLTRGQRQTKRQIRTDNNWNGEDANISDKVSNWVKTYLFQLYKFLPYNWMEYSNDKSSLSSYTRMKLKIECDDYVDLWDRVICPTINTKYTTIRSNLSSEIRKAYKSKSLHLLFLYVLSYTTMTNSFICSCQQAIPIGA